MFENRVLIYTLMLMAPVVLIAGSIIWRLLKKNKETNGLQKVISTALDYDNDGKKNKQGIEGKFITYWAQLLKPAGLVNPISDDKRNATIILIIILALFLIPFVLTMNIAIALFPPAFFLIGLIIVCKKKIKKVETMMSEQVPAFLSALKSNIQSNQTPERALMSAIDNTAEPLYSELKTVKSLIETGTFQSALSALRQRTKNEYLIFLASCIELSVEVGANLEEQITIIEVMIREKQALARKIDSAVAENQPILYVIAGALPFLFVYMYMNNEQTRDFWFHSVISWILFILVFVIVGVGIWLGNKIINKVRKM